MSDIDEALEALEWFTTVARAYLTYTHDDITKMKDMEAAVRQALEELRLYRQAYGHPGLCGLERQRVPEGWKLVPVKPTGAIFEAWCDAGLPPSINAMAKAWRKLLAASEADDETS